MKTPPRVNVRGGALVNGIAAFVFGQTPWKGGNAMTERENDLIARLTDTLERMHLDDYLEYVSNRKRMIFRNLLYGAIRGLGFTLGFTVLGALAIVLIRHLVVENLSGIGNFLAEVIHEIEKRM